MSRKFTGPAESNGGGLVANRITDRLREEILAQEDGYFLGSEEDLLERFGVSRPTFRQTSRMLEQEQILVVKRGQGGGYYTRKPSIDIVARATATYLRSRHTTTRQLVEASKAASSLMVELASNSRDEIGRLAFARSLEVLRNYVAEEGDFVEYHQQEMEFGACLAALAANPALELFVASLYRVALFNAQDALLRDRLERRVAFRKLRVRLGDAILAGESEVAIALSARSIDSLLDWLDERGAESY